MSLIPFWQICEFSGYPYWGGVISLVLIIGSRKRMSVNSLYFIIRDSNMSPLSYYKNICY
jgi:hypothetical protein